MCVRFKSPTKSSKPCLSERNAAEEPNRNYKWRAERVCGQCVRPYAKPCYLFVALPSQKGIQLVPPSIEISYFDV